MHLEESYSMIAKTFRMNQAKLVPFYVVSVWLVITGIAHGQAKRDLTCDYGVGRGQDLICHEQNKSKECIQSFVLAYETGKGKFKPALTMPAKDVCKARKEEGGGWTCTALIPKVPGKEKKPVTWVVWAVTASGVTSTNSNPVTIPQE